MDREDCGTLHAARIACLVGLPELSLTWAQKGDQCGRPDIRLAILGDSYEALGDFQAAADRWSQWPPLAIQRASQLVARENYQQAEPLLQALVQQPSFADLSTDQRFRAYEQLGLSRYELGDYARAAPVLNQAVQLRPERTDLLVWQGMAMRETGRLEEARAVLGQAVGEIPASRPQLRNWALEQLGLTLEEQGDLVTAREAYREALQLVEDIPGYSPGRLAWFRERMAALDALLD
jgi:tetratricopeptide (TPR) repeat protein